MPHTIRTVSDATFVDVVLGCATTCVVGFYDAETRSAGAWLEQFAAENIWVSCAHLDVSKNPHTAHTYAITEVPSYLIFRRGAAVSAAATPEELAVLLESDGTLPLAPPPRTAAGAGPAAEDEQGRAASSSSPDTHRTKESE